MGESTPLEGKMMIGHPRVKKMEHPDGYNNLAFMSRVNDVSAKPSRASTPKPNGSTKNESGGSSLEEKKDSS